jgi:hypothetical protein
MKLFVSAALLLAALAFSPSGFASCPNGPHTLYSQRAVSLDNDLVKIQSPDRKKILIVKRVWDDKSEEGVYFSFTVQAGSQSFTTHLEGYTNGEALWSLDSSAFAVTLTNNCGATAFVFSVGQGGVKAVDVDSVVRKAAVDVHGAVQKVFGIPLKCEIGLEVNSGVIDWLGASDELLIAAEVTPCSFCECSEMYEVYDVSLRQTRIIATYPQMTAKKKFWKLLGCELRDADDGCAERLQSK